jgi:hypothetical protein
MSDSTGVYRPPGGPGRVQKFRDVRLPPRPPLRDRSITPHRQSIFTGRRSPAPVPAGSPSSAQDGQNPAVADPRVPANCGFKWVSKCTSFWSRVNHLRLSSSPADTIIHIQVDEPAVKFSVHSSLLCSSSEFMKTRKKPEWDRTGADIQLPDQSAPPLASTPIGFTSVASQVHRLVRTAGTTSSWFSPRPSC